MVSEQRIQDGFTIIEVAGRVERIQDCVSLTREVERMIKEGAGKIILDLTNVYFISASFSGFLVSMFRQSDSCNTVFKIVLPPDNPNYQLLKDVSLDSVLDVYSCVETALQSQNPGTGCRNPG